LIIGPGTILFNAICAYARLSFDTEGRYDYFAKACMAKKTAKKSTRKTAGKKAAKKAGGKKNRLGVKNSLVNNINARKKKGKSRPKKKSTVSKKSYSAMKKNWGRKKKK
jgi:hypothetical protein